MHGEGQSVDAGCVPKQSADVVVSRRYGQEGVQRLWRASRAAILRMMVDDADRTEQVQERSVENQSATAFADEMSSERTPSGKVAPCSNRQTLHCWHGRSGSNVSAAERTVNQHKSAPNVTLFASDAVRRKVPRSWIDDGRKPCLCPVTAG